MLAGVTAKTGVAEIGAGWDWQPTAANAMISNHTMGFFIVYPGFINLLTLHFKK